MHCEHAAFPPVDLGGMREHTELKSKTSAQPPHPAAIASPGADPPAAPEATSASFSLRRRV